MSFTNSKETTTAKKSDYHLWHTPYEQEERTEIVGDIKYKEHLDSRNVEKKISRSFYWSPQALTLKEQVEFWIDSKPWFNDRGLCWRRGAILDGKPGTGKSAMIQQVAKELDLPIKKINLSTYNDAQFLEKMKDIKNSIVLFEDIDIVFDQRENDSENSFILKVNYDVFINALSNYTYASNKFMVCTTNHIERLDAALIRPGRFDCKIHTSFLDQEGKKFIATNILRDWPEEIEKSLETGEMTVAEFENYCIEIAILRYNKEHNKI